MGRVRAVRLVLAYDDEGLRLAAATPRAKRAPASGPISVEPAANAITVDVRRKGGVTVYRRVLSEPIAQSVEVFDAPRPRRLATVPRRGAFAVVVPAVNERTQVVVEAGPDAMPRQSAFQAAVRTGSGRRELGRFDLPRMR